MKKSEYGVNTNLVRGGIKRSQFKETSEAIFFNSGFVLQSKQKPFLQEKKQDFSITLIPP